MRGRGLMGRKSEEEREKGGEWERGSEGVRERVRERVSDRVSDWVREGGREREWGEGGREGDNVENESAISDIIDMLHHCHHQLQSVREQLTPTHSDSEYRTAEYRLWE